MAPRGPKSWGVGAQPGTVLYSRVPTSKGYTILYCIVPVIVHTRTTGAGRYGKYSRLLPVLYCTLVRCCCTVRYGTVRYTATVPVYTVPTPPTVPYGTLPVCRDQYSVYTRVHCTAGTVLAVPACTCVHLYQASTVLYRPVPVQYNIVSCKVLYLQYPCTGTRVQYRYLTVQYSTPVPVPGYSTVPVQYRG